MTTAIALYAALVSTATAGFGIWTALSQRRPRLYVDLYFSATINPPERFQAGLAVQVVNIGPIPVHIDYLGITVDDPNLRYIRLDDHRRGEQLPGKLQPGDDTQFFIELAMAAKLGLRPGPTSGFAVVSQREKRQWHSKPLVIPPDAAPFLRSKGLVPSKLENQLRT